MSLRVLDAHTGQSYTADAASLQTLEAFRSWLAEASGLAAGQLILLTSAGKQVKVQSLRERVSRLSSSSLRRH